MCGLRGAEPNVGVSEVRPSPEQHLPACLPAAQARSLRARDLWMMWAELSSHACACLSALQPRHVRLPGLLRHSSIVRCAHLFRPVGHPGHLEVGAARRQDETREQRRLQPVPATPRRPRRRYPGGARHRQSAATAAEVPLERRDALARTAVGARKRRRVARAAGRAVQGPVASDAAAGQAQRQQPSKCSRGQPAEPKQHSVRRERRLPEVASRCCVSRRRPLQHRT